MKKPKTRHLVIMSFLYWGLRRLVELVGLGFRSEDAKEVEIIVLRHQLQVLRRQVARPDLAPQDRALLAAASRVLPKLRWGIVCRAPRDGSCLASQARCRPLDLPAAPRTTAEDGRDPSPRRPLGQREPDLGLLSHP